MEVGTSQKAANKEVYKKVTIKAQGILIEQSFFLLELGGVDVVLVMDWLSSLGDIRANFQKLFTTSKQGDRVQRI